VPEIACPSCGGPVGPEGRCVECRLDASLLVRIRATAELLARRAAGRAAAAAWQEAYDHAAESLRLAWRDNDLAALVLVVAAAAGARGGVRKVPRPRMERLPAGLGGHAGFATLVAELAALRQRLEAKHDPASAAAELATFRARHPGLLAPAGARVEAPAGQVRRADSRRVRRWAAAAAILAGVLAGGVAAGVWRAGAGSRAGTAPAAAVERGRGQVQALASRVLLLQEELRQARLETRPTVAPGLASPAVAAPAGEVRALASRAAWLRGLRASRRRRWDAARHFLELAAATSGRDDYWRGDTLFYLAKTYHRLGRRELAAGAYRHLVAEQPGSALAQEADRLRARLARGEGVER
jgi:hypothetical protein